MNYVLIGTGNFSRTYAEALASMPDSRIVACVSRSGRSPQALPTLPSYGTLEEVREPFEAVIIITPNALHHQGAMAAAALGKHVVCEKPLDIGMEAMEWMISACRRAGLRLSVAYQRRMNPDNLFLKRMLDQGGLGRVLAVDLSCKFWRGPEYYSSGDYRGGYTLDGGGPFMQQACHNLDLYRWLFGYPTEVHSVLGNLFHDIEAEDHGAAIFRHENGAIGTMVASTISRPDSPARLEIVTTKGRLTTLDDRIVEWDIDGVEDPRTAVGGDTEIGTTLSNAEAHRRILADFESAVESGQDPFITGEDASLTTKLVLEIYRSGVRRSR